MNSNELFEEFLKYCNNYEYDLYGIVLKNEDTWLRIQKPYDPEQNDFLIYEILKGNTRCACTVSNLHELLSICKDTIGEDSVTKSHGYF